MIVDTKEARKAIGRETVKLFKQHIDKLRAQRVERKTP